MKQYRIQQWITTLLLPIALFGSCNVEEIGRESGNPLPEGVTRLAATIRSGVQTRAVGDLLNDATDDEKRVDRIAFFVHTDAEGMQVYEPAKTGETYTDFPNKVQLVAVNASDPSQGYTATVDLTAGAGHEADIIAVANLPEDYDYSQVVSWQGLLDSVAVGTFTASMPLCTGNDGAGNNYAFAMYGSTSVVLHKEKEEVFNLSLERLTARIDITNEAYVTGMTDADPKGGFLLTSVRILHARPQSYIVPQMDYVSPDVLTVSDWTSAANAIRLCKVEADGTATDVTAGDPAAQATATCQRIWHSLYTYENHETDHAPTGLEIKGKLRGQEVTRQIALEVTDATTGVKKPVPIVRNHRYLVLIKPAPGLTDITYNVTVGEWNAVDTVNVQPTQKAAPEISGVTCTGTGCSYSDTDKKTVSAPATTADASFSFIAVSPFDSDALVVYPEEYTGSEWITIAQGDPVETKASTGIKRSYTVNLVGQSAPPTVEARSALLLIRNAANATARDTIYVKQTVTP